jgi:phage terminase small subunit
MAGIKGKGGVKGRSGGARPGAGRKPKVKPEATLPAADENQTSVRKDPLDFLADVYNDPKHSPNVRVRAAIAHAQYLHLKRHDGGKKDEQAGAAKKASTGKFAASAPPLRVVGRS